jgi:hypothetical protein
MPPELTPFNLPDALTVAGKRDASTLATQSLYLLNNAFIVEQSKQLAARVLKTSDDDAARARAAYRRVLAREPGGAELQRAQEFVREADLSLVSAGDDHLARAWAAFCQALLSSNEFRYVD